MSTQRVRRMLALFRENIQSGVESIREARRFVERIGALSRMEREVLDMALRNRRQLDEMCSKLPPMEPRDERTPRLPVATMRICKAHRPPEGQRLSAG